MVFSYSTAYIVIKESERSRHWRAGSASDSALVNAIGAWVQGSLPERNRISSPSASNQTVRELPTEHVFNQQQRPRLALACQRSSLKRRHSSPECPTPCKARCR